MKIKLIYLMMITLALPCLSMDKTDIYTKGYMEFKQYKFAEAKKTLEEIKNNDPNAAYIYTFTLGEDSAIHISHNQSLELLRATKLGSLYALSRLVGNRSFINPNVKKTLRAKLVNILDNEIDHGNIEALVLKGDMYAIDNYEKYIDWISKAAKKGHAPSQYKLAKYYDNGKGWFLSESNRKSKITELYKESAAQLYQPALRYFAFYSNSLSSHKRNELINYLIDNGDASTILELAISYERGSDIFDKDKIKSIYYCKIYTMSIKPRYSISKDFEKSCNSRLNSLDINEKKKILHQVDMYLSSHDVYDKDDINEHTLNIDPSRLGNFILSLAEKDLY